MPEVTLKGPRVIDGAARYPVEGAISVSDAEYERLLEAGAIETDEDDDDGLDAENVARLKEIAAEEGVDLGTATRKDDILTAIRAHRATVA